MNPRLEAKYLQLEKSRNRLLNKLGAYEESLLNQVPQAGKWSVNQTVAHLIQVDELTLNSIQSKLKKENSLHTVSFRNEFNAILLKLALKSGMKFKAPASVATVPDTAHLPALRHQWDEIRYKLEDLLTGLPPHLLDKCIFKHPRVGLLTINQTLHFLQDHFDHHLSQIQQQLTK